MATVKFRSHICGRKYMSMPFDAVNHTCFEPGWGGMWQEVLYLTLTGKEFQMPKFGLQNNGEGGGRLSESNNTTL